MWQMDEVKGVFGQIFGILVGSKMLRTTCPQVSGEGNRHFLKLL